MRFGGGWTIGFGCHYPFSTQPHSCRSVSLDVVLYSLGRIRIGEIRTRLTVCPRPTFCIPKAASARRRLQFLASRHTRMRHMVTWRKGLQGHSRPEADLLFTHDLSGSHCTTCTRDLRSIRRATGRDQELAVLKSALHGVWDAQVDIVILCRSVLVA